VKLDGPGDIGRTLAPLSATLTEAAHPEMRARKVAEALAPFGPDGPWKYAPEQEREKVRRQVEAAEDERAGEALFTIEHEADRCAAALAAWEAAVMVPLDPATAWQRARGTIGILPPSDVLQITTAAELQYARFDRSLRDAAPSRVTAAYQAALKTPLEFESSNLIRWVELQHTAGWTGRPIDGDVTESQSAQDLHQTIQAARRSRIPPHYVEARAAIEQAEALVARVRAWGVRPQRPPKRDAA